MRDDATMPGGDEARAALLLRTLERLLGIAAVGLRPALDEASTLLAVALGAGKVDVFLYEPGSDTLVAVGTSDTPMGRRERALGLDRLPLSNGGLVARAYRTGASCLIGRADLEPDELRGIVEGLAVRSELLVPLACAAGRRGVFAAVSATPDRFDEADLALAVAAAGWVGLLLDRARLVEAATAEAERRGRRAAGEDLARLTRREQEVAALVAAGLTNAEIAERLVVEEGTVANHIHRVLTKLSLRGRTQLAVWAVERGLHRSDWAADADQG